MKSRNLLIKNLAIILIIVTVFTTSSCSKSTDDANNDPPSEPSNEYANYDFYMSHQGCSIVNEFSKNFLPIAGFTKAENFYVNGNNLYTFGAKKYRNNPQAGIYTKSDNFSGYINKNGNDIYENVGGNSSTVFGVQEVGADLYFVTGFKSQEGGVSVEQAVCSPKVFKNGVLISTLQGPFNNSSYLVTGNGNTLTYSYSLAISISNIVVNGSNVIVSGSCQQFGNAITSYGYWINGIYTESKRVSGVNLYYINKVLVSDTGDVYNNFSGSNALYKNNVNILNASVNNVFIRDFGLLNNDVYFIGINYTNSYNLGIYKNGALECNVAGVENNADYRIEIVDNKIFICGSTINGEDKMSVFEYKTATKTLDKVGSSPTPYQSCGAIRILNFQAKKKQ